MSSSAVAALIQNRLESTWALTPIRLPNRDFDPAGRPFVEVAFPGSGISRGAIGDASNPMWSEAGSFMAHVFVPQNVGDGTARQLADALADVFLRWGPPPVGLTIHERYASQDGERLVQGRPWYGVSFGVRYEYQSIG